MNTPGEFCLPSGIHKVGSIPLWWIYLGIWSPGKSRLPGLYDTSIIISLQKMPGVWYSRESRLHSIFIPGEFWLPRVGIWHRQVFLQTSWVGYSLYSSPGGLDSPDEYTRESHDSTVLNTPGSLESPMANTPEIRLRIRITPRIFDKVRNPSEPCLRGPGTGWMMEKTEMKNLVSVLSL